MNRFFGDSTRSINRTFCEFTFIKSMPASLAVGARIVFFTLLAVLPSTALVGQIVITQTFSFNGTMQSFTVPACVTSVIFDVRGAQGGGAATAPGGLGGRSQGVITVTPFEVLEVW